MPQLSWGAEHAFDVTIERGLLRPGSTRLASLVPSARGLVVVDRSVDTLYGTRLRSLVAESLPGFGVHVLPASEQEKTMESVLGVCSVAQQAGLGRRDTLVAVGGGVCCDVVSVAATLIRRGLPYVCVPTTLLGQVDAGIAVKGAVNLGCAKNYLGSFHPPAAVAVDPDFLVTVPAAELRSGLAEMIKIAVLRDPAMVEDLRRHGPDLVASGFAAPCEIGDRLITRAVELMLEELGKDPRESGELRRFVDFGHTFSPVLEARSGYALRHGEAVAIDMALSVLLAGELGLTTQGVVDEVLSTLTCVGLPITSELLTDDAAEAALQAAIAHRDGDLNLVVPLEIGIPTFVARDQIPDLALDLARARARSYAAAALERDPHGRDGLVGSGPQPGSVSS